MNKEYKKQPTLLIFQDRGIINSNLLLRNRAAMEHLLGIYIHIPFCVQKCRYCDFLSAPAGREVQKKYIDVLLEEIEKYHEVLENSVSETVFFGGGTPSILEGEDILRIMEKLRKCGNISETAEISIEANPGTVTKEKLSAWKCAGVNRISFGLQSADDAELRNLGRIHSFEQFSDNFYLARELGFSNMNVDLMSALPGQTEASWEKTLEKVMMFEPEHISAYSLIIEEGTPFFDAYSEHPELLPTEEEERNMYYRTKEVLEKFGFHRYEISNYAKPGYECRHNLSYWERTDYLGLGLGAASLLGRERKSNQTDLSRYLNKEYEGERQFLSDTAAMEEYFFLGLRKTEGIRLTPYLEQYRQKVERLVQEGFLIQEGEMIRLTDLGIDLSNRVLSEFLV